MAIYTVRQGCVSIRSNAGKEICRASRKIARGHRNDGHWFLFIPVPGRYLRLRDAWYDRVGRGPNVTGIIHNDEALVEAAEKFRADHEEDAQGKMP